MIFSNYQWLSIMIFFLYHVALFDLLSREFNSTYTQYFFLFKRTDLNIDIIILIHSWNYNIFFRLKACFVFKMLSQNIFLIWYLHMSLVSTARRDLLSHVVSYWPANELNVEKTINVKYYIRRLDNKGMLLLQYGHSDLSFMQSFIHLYF